MSSQLFYINSGPRQYDLSPVVYYPRRYWEFQAVLQGQIAPIQPPATPQFRAESLWLFEPGCAHGWTGVPGEIAEIVVFHLSEPDKVLQRLLKAGGGLIVVSLTKPDIVWLRKVCNELHNEWVHPTELTHLKIERLMIDLSLLMLERMQYQSKPHFRDRATDRVERALYWFRQNLHQNPGISEVARAVGVSEVHLRRLCQSVRGQSPKAAMQEIRMEQVAAFLDDPEITVEAAAAQFGYADASSLSRSYRQFFGRSPRKG